MTALIDAAREISDFLSERGWNFCLVGGFALTQSGEPRTTKDIDLCLLTGTSDEERFIDTLLERFAGRVPNAAKFAQLNRVLLIRASNQVPIDIALAWTPFEETMIARSTPFDYSLDLSIPTATAEDLVVTKAFAARPQDWVDVRGILARQKGKLDWDQILGELTPLAQLKEAPEILQQLKSIRAEIDAS
jgi:hypothetical protein